MGEGDEGTVVIFQQKVADFGFSAIEMLILEGAETFVNVFCCCGVVG
jgi:hypothetical protein